MKILTVNSEYNAGDGVYIFTGTKGALYCFKPETETETERILTRRETVQLLRDNFILKSEIIDIIQECYEIYILEVILSWTEASAANKFKVNACIDNYFNSWYENRKNEFYSVELSRDDRDGIIDNVIFKNDHDLL